MIGHAECNCSPGEARGPGGHACPKMGRGPHPLIGPVRAWQARGAWDFSSHPCSLLPGLLPLHPHGSHPVGPRPGSLQPFPLESLEQLLFVPSPEILKVTLKGVTCKEVRWLSGHESTCQCRKQAFDPGSARSPRDRNGNPFLYSCLENPMDRGGWRATVHGVPKESDTT